MDTEYITSIALGIAISACCGFRVFIPLLGASIAGYFNWYSFPQDMQWMASVPALWCFGTAAVLELMAYYIPFVDHLSDAIATPLSVVAGTVLAFSFLPVTTFPPLIQWGLALISGGAAAGTIQLGTGLLRFTSSKFTAGMGNPVIATTENVFAIFGTILSFVVPVAIAVVMALLIFWILSKLAGKLIR